MIGRASPRTRAARALVAALLLLPFGAMVASAHPLGNFTVNHHAGIRVEPGRVLLDVVIDQAEIPTFQATSDLDEDGDGELTDEELTAAKLGGCVAIGEALTLEVDGAPARLRLIEAGLSFPPGNGGLETMRQVCTFEALLRAPIAGPTVIRFADAFEPARIGWREMTLSGSGVTITGGDLPAESPTERLLAYPGSLAEAPDVRDVTFTASSGGRSMPPLDVPDADPVGPLLVGAIPAAPVPPPPSPPASPSAPSTAASPSSPAPITVAGSPAGGAVPGGEGVIPGILRSVPVTPAIALLSLLTAVLLGAGHALTPGHGKTLMAAYLVGTRGTPRHALGLGAAVSVSHTVGILALAFVVLGAGSLLPPDLVVRVAPVVAALTIVGIGGWMLLAEVRRGRGRPAAGDHAALDDDGRDHGAGGDAEAHDHPFGWQHEHGGGRHGHPPGHPPGPGSTLTWRSLLVLGLAGGLIPSTNALLILLATIAAGQPAWGIVLVAAFGLGMAGVMAGVGLAFVYAGGLAERTASRAGLGRVTRLVPLGAAVLVLSVGLVLTTQALSAARLG